MEDEFFTPRQLSKRLKLSEMTLCRMRMNGSGPTYHKLGRTVKYRWSDVQKWLANRSVSSTSDPRYKEF